MMHRTVLVLDLTTATPAAASHPCIDDGMCPPHEGAPHPREFINALWDRVACLALAQPPTPCV